jgi:hypothetical protein
MLNFRILIDITKLLITKNISQSMKHIMLFIKCLFFLAFCSFLFSCKKELVCDSSQLTSIELLFNDSLYQKKYPCKNLKISIYDTNLQKDSNNFVIIIDTSSHNLRHFINLTNEVKSTSRIEISLKDKKFILSDFVFKKTINKTLFWHTYQSCNLFSYKMNSNIVYGSYIELITGL